MPHLARLSGWRWRAILGTVCLSVLLWGGLIGVRMLFPLDYRNEILEWCSTYELEPAWVASVIRNESRFRSDAVSPAGAIGLMQIMPETGEWIAQQLQLPNFTTALLEDASLNLAMGTWYLRHLLDRFPSREATLMAYNAGPANAERWEGNLELAFPETQQYVRRVRLSLPIYHAYFAVPWVVDLIPSLHF
ncbi:lytic transglycosylase domain-containing protein [Candidatus Bipolaricaulota bacterium]